MANNDALLKKPYQDEIKELVKLVRMDEKYAALVADGFLPIDEFSSSYNFQRRVREALIYSIFRPCNALEALIYQGATAGF